MINKVKYMIYKEGVLKESRRRNIKLVIQIQNELNSRIAETLNELVRDKDADGSDEMVGLLGGIKYKPYALGSQNVNRYYIKFEKCVKNVLS